MSILRTTRSKNSPVVIIKSDLFYQFPIQDLEGIDEFVDNDSEGQLSLICINKYHLKGQLVEGTDVVICKFMLIRYFISMKIHLNSFMQVVTTHPNVVFLISKLVERLISASVLGLLNRHNRLLEHRFVYCKLGRNCYLVRISRNFEDRE